MLFNSVSVDTLDLNPFKSISKDWLLVTSGNEEKFNTMTVSWGGLGFLWNKNVSFAFIRPQRYTFEFMEKNDYYTLSFLECKDKDILKYCGKFSGRDVDKVKETGLVPIFEKDYTYFEQSKLVFVCKKIYTDNINSQNFLVEEIEKNYPKKDYHKMFIGEIIDCLKKDE